MKTRLWQLFDEQGRPITANGAPKHEVAVRGLLHGASHLWIWHRKGDDIEVLIQKRAASKVNWPGLMDKSAGGHLAFGESPLDAAIRKAEGELGLELAASDLRLIGIYHWHALFGEGNLIENEFQWMYLTEADDVSPTLSEKEVQSVEWMSLDELKRQTLGVNSSDHFVPYGQAYFMVLCEAIQHASDRRPASC